LHVEIDNLNDPLVGFCFIRDIDLHNIFETNLDVYSFMKLFNFIYFFKIAWHNLAIYCGYRWNLYMPYTIIP
jgi:hypothetical protein